MVNCVLCTAFNVSVILREAMRHGALLKNLRRYYYSDQDDNFLCVIPACLKLESSPCLPRLDPSFKHTGMTSALSLTITSILTLALSSSIYTRNFIRHVGCIFGNQGFDNRPNLTCSSKSCNRKQLVKIAIQIISINRLHLHHAYIIK